MKSSDIITDTSPIKDVIDSDKTKMSEIDGKLARFSKMKDYLVVVLDMLKDSGIKTDIIKQYLKSINQIVNTYLSTLDFFVDFSFDEEFDEKIRSRHRDEFSYFSFSEGEKQRIDLALLFTWRDIARMKNSVVTNLLILDETFDSSLDYDGVESLYKIINSLSDDTNVFVISHKEDVIDGRFDKKLIVSKENNFTNVRIA